MKPTYSVRIRRHDGRLAVLTVKDRSVWKTRKTAQRHADDWNRTFGPADGPAFVETN